MIAPLAAGLWVGLGVGFGLAFAASEVAAKRRVKTMVIKTTKVERESRLSIVEWKIECLLFVKLKRCAVILKVLSFVGGGRGDKESKK